MLLTCPFKASFIGDEDDAVLLSYDEEEKSKGKAPTELSIHITIIYHLPHLTILTVLTVLRFIVFSMFTSQRFAS